VSTLTVEGIHAGYGPVQVLHGLDFSVGDGEVGVILGANGAGKTTTLRAISGMIPVKGRVMLDGQSIAGKSAETIVRRGVAHVPQGRGTFMDLSVHENLRLGAFTRRDADGVRKDIERAYEWFPVLGERRGQVAGSLSGGEQQMLAIARALMLRPKVLLLDEPSLGLAPLVVRELFRILTQINAELGTTMLLVEQNAALALDLGQHAYVLETGRIVFHGKASEMKEHPDVRRAYLGY
jgi:branched-chain amino acid transport system ATP-binding protein